MKPIGTKHYIVHADCMDLYTTTSLEEAKRKCNWYRCLYEHCNVYQVINYYRDKGNRPIKQIVY